MDKPGVEKEFEKVATFTDGNFTFTVRQPKEEPTAEELEPLYNALGKMIYD